MIKVIDGIKVYYEYIDNNKNNNIVFLHGWGQNIKMMKYIGEKLEINYNYLYIDLPGFGKSMEPKEVLSVYDYSNIINELVSVLELKNIVIIGHSFGGKIGLVYASKYDINKLICLASPYKKTTKKITLKTKIYKIIKKYKSLRFITNFLSKYIGSTDYNNANLMMRNILVSTVNLDIRCDIKKIKCPTLLIWGTNDTQVKIEDAYELNNLIANSKLIEYKNLSHYAYLENISEVSSEIKKFIEMENN